MKNFFCNCGAVVFFENNQCLSCGSELGWCPACESIGAIHKDANGQYYCSHASCGAPLSKCHNYAVEHVCNRCTLTEKVTGETENLCDYCRFNETIPDLSVEGNREKWQRIEVAKRRLLYTLDTLNIPYGSSKEGFEVPLSFDFKGDSSKKSFLWFNMSKHEQVFTGHADGKVTINIREADDIEREKARISFGEAHRTVIGHFRHEMGHYFWDLLVKGKCEQEYVAIFADHKNPDYSTALEHYYEHGPKAGWQSHYISAYATMHSWEDFAESFAAYLDMVSVVDTAFHAFSLNSLNPITASFKDIAKEYAQLGLFMNEMNRAVGLIDLVPEVHTQAILRKIEFIHDLLRKAGQQKALQQ